MSDSESRIRVMDFSSPPKVIHWEMVGSKRGRGGDHEAILVDVENRNRMHVPVDMLADTDDPETKQLCLTGRVPF